MVSFFACLAFLILGYFIYGRFVEKVFRPDDRTTPAYAMEDGADYVPMKSWRVFLIQLLNIAGRGDFSERRTQHEKHYNRILKKLSSLSTERSTRPPASASSFYSVSLRV